MSETDRRDKKVELWPHIYPQPPQPPPTNSPSPPNCRISWDIKDIKKENKRKQLSKEVVTSKTKDTTEYHGRQNRNRLIWQEKLTVWQHQWGVIFVKLLKIAIVSKSQKSKFFRNFKSQVCGKVKISSLWESFCSVCRLIALRFLRGKVSKFPTGNGNRKRNCKKLGKYINFCRIHS